MGIDLWISSVQFDFYIAHFNIRLAWLLAERHVLFRQVIANTNFVRTNFDSFHHFLVLRGGRRPSESLPLQNNSYRIPVSDCPCLTRTLLSHMFVWCRTEFCTTHEYALMFGSSAQRVL